MLKPAYPSSPRRPPIEHLYFQVFDPDNEPTIFLTQSFAALYSAQYWLNTITNSSASQRWIANNILELKRDGYTLVIKGTQLEDIIEYKPTKEEQQWTAPYPDSVKINHLRDFHIPARKAKTETTEPKQPKQEQKPPKRHKSTKNPDNPNQITVAQIADSIDLAPNKARNILRKAGIKKPASGWIFDKNDKQVKIITKLLTNNK